MATLNKFIEMFRNLKSDAVPRPPRPSKVKKETPTEEDNENVDSSNEPEEILIESADDDEPEPEPEKKPKFKTSFFKPSKKEGKSRKTGKHSNSTVNTQAGGNVINVVNSKYVRWGNDYNMGPTYMHPQPPTQHRNEHDDEEPEEEIKLNNTIRALLKAKIKPEHDYLEHISKNLGKTWHKFFIKLGYSKNKIETMELDTAQYGVAEARYKLLRDWVNNEDDPSLGRLATLLWDFGERLLVKELSVLYKKNKD